MTIDVPRLHAVTNEGILALSDLMDRASMLACSPQVAIHVRAESMGGKKLTQIACQISTSAHQGARTIVNDRVDVALLVDADGVHLPARGMSVTAARSLMGPEKLVGRSAHSPEEAQRAADDGADYVFLGPIWETTSHPGRTAIGLDAIGQSSPARVVAIGGVTAARIPQCLEAGAYGVAAISALWQVETPRTVTEEMLLLLGCDTE